MVWSDGPYAMKKAPWDMMGIDGLADWYAPHVEAWAVCAPSATVYLWGRRRVGAAGSGHEGGGWMFRALYLGQRDGPAPGRIDTESLPRRPDVTRFDRGFWRPYTRNGHLPAVC